MLQRIGLVLLLGLTLAVTFSIAVGRAADHDHDMEIGKKGDFMFYQEMRVGDVTLPPGHYRFQHRVDGSEHYVQFTAMKGMHDGTTVERPPSRLEDVGEIKCRVEPVDSKVKATTIRWTKTGEAGRINRIEVKGETVAHVF